MKVVPLAKYAARRFGYIPCGATWVARLAASNLLDGKKIERIRNFDGDSVTELTDNMLTGSVDEFEREQEQAGPVVQLVLRANF